MGTHRLRFVLDENVDAELVSALLRRGHDAWTIPDSGLAQERDNAVAIYAHAKRAILVTHDDGFAENLRRNLFTQAVWLDCEDPRAVEVMMTHLDDVLQHLWRGKETFIRLSRYIVEVHKGGWAAEWIDADDDEASG